MVLTIGPYNPLGRISDLHAGDVDHPGGAGVIRFDLRVLTRYGEVVIDFGGFGDLLSWNDTLSTEGASGTWTLKMKATLCNTELLKKLHPGMVVEAYCARNDDPLVGVIRDPSKIKRIDTTPPLPIVPPPSPSQTQSTGATGLQNASPKTVDDNIRLILAECQRQGVTDPNQIAYILATAEHESRLTPIPEESSGRQYEGRDDLGNNQPGDGARYKGRGFVQLTGRDNYAKYSKLTGKDLIGNPDAALDPNVSAYVLVHGMKNGVFTTARLDDYIGNGKADFYGARRIVNGTDRAGLIAGYADKWKGKLPKYVSGPAVLTDTTVQAVAAPAPTTATAVSTEVIGKAVEPVDDPYLDKCPHLLMRGIITDYGRSVENETSLTVTGETYGKIYKDAYVLTDLNAPELASTSLEVRNAVIAPLGVSLIYYRLLKEWVENFWGMSKGWEARTRVIPFPPNYLTRINNEGAVWANLQYLAIPGFFHLFVDHTGAIVWEKLPWSSRSQSLIAGRNWEDLPLLPLPSWKIVSWNDRLSEQGISNFLRCVPTQQGTSGGQSAVSQPGLIYNIGSIRQYGGPSKRELQFPVGISGDQYYTSDPRRKQQATINSFTSLCALECIRWYDRPVQRVGVTARGESAWRINMRVSITEDWHCADAKPGEYYISARTHNVDVHRGSWTTSLDLVRDRRSRYLGIGVGEIPVVTDDATQKLEIPRFVKSKFNVSGLKNLTAPVDGKVAPADPPYLRLPLVPDEYYFFDRLQGKVVPIGNDPIAWARKEVIPKLGEESKAITVIPPSQGPITATTAGVGGKNAAILASAQKLRGFDTSSGPDGGNNACVYAVNKVLNDAGTPPPWGNSVYVPDAENALKRTAVKVSEADAQPGDIIIWDDGVSRGHIGIVTAPGAKSVLSNSSSKARFSWEAPNDSYVPHYGGGRGNIYRLK